MKRFKNVDRLILTDCDGVCLDWEWAFNVWMGEHGFEEIAGSKLNYDMSIRYDIPKEQVKKLIRIFNESEIFLCKCMDPIRGLPIINSIYLYFGCA